MTIDILKADIQNEAKLLESRVDFVEWKANIKQRALTLQMKREKVHLRVSSPSSLLSSLIYLSLRSSFFCRAFCLSLTFFFFGILISLTWDDIVISTVAFNS